MIRTLLATTALAALLATNALAQAPATQSTTEAPAAATPAPMSGDNPADPGAMSPATTADASATNAAVGDYVQKLETDQYLASNLTGTNLYETNAPDANSIGEVENFVLGNDGKVAAVVISTSGLDQNKTVAAPVDRIDWVQGQDGNQRAVLKGGVAELQSAPAFTSDTAQQAAQGGAMTPGTGAQSTDSNMAAANPGGSAMQGEAPAANSASMGSANGYLASLGNDQKLSEDIIGSNVYSGPGDDAQTIGSVNDLVLTKMGDVPAAVIGVGGFLGIGEKNVGVPFQKLQVQAENGDNSEPRMILAASKDQLTNAPTFDDGERNNASVAAAGAGAGAATGTALGAGGQAGTAQGDMAQGNMATDTSTAAQNTTADTMNADPSTTASTNPNDRAAMTPVSGPELTADNLNGVAVYGPNDQNIGKVGDIALTGDGRVDAIVVDVGGFLGIGSKPVAVAMDNLQFMRDSNGNVNVYTQFTQDQLKAAPEFNRESYAQNRSSMRVEQGNAPAPTAGSGENNGQPAQ